MLPFAELTPVCPCLCFTGEISTSCTTPNTSYQNWTEEKDHISWAANNALLNASQEAAGILCHRGMLLPDDQLGIHQDPQEIFCKPAFQLADPQSVLVHGVFPWLQTPYFLLLNFMSFLSTHFLEHLRSFWMAALPSGLSDTHSFLYYLQTCWEYTLSYYAGNLWRCYTVLAAAPIPGVNHHQMTASYPSCYWPQAFELGTSVFNPPHCLLI